MKKLLLLTALGAIVSAFGLVSVQAGAKVKVCHIPPGNPANFHTITVSENALSAHLGHGDLSGSCSANAEALCDDGDACTIDAMDAETETCVFDHPPVDCDDGMLCTQDSCDSANGCQYAPVVCNDDNACTVDSCNPSNGQCTGTQIDCEFGECDEMTGECPISCDGVTCDPIDQCHEAGQCVSSGGCGDPVPLPNGTACNDGDPGTVNDACLMGVCTGEDP